MKRLTAFVLALVLFAAPTVALADFEKSGNSVYTIWDEALQQDSDES